MKGARTTCLGLRDAVLLPTALPLCWSGHLSAPGGKIERGREREVLGVHNFQKCFSTTGSEVVLSKQLLLANHVIRSWKSKMLNDEVQERDV